MNFTDPVRLWLLLSLVGLLLVYVGVQRRRQAYAVRFTNLALLDQVAPRRPGWRRHLTALAFLVAIGSLIVALARPTREEQVPREKATVMMAIDTSLSMEAEDVEPSRVDAAKEAAKTFLDTVPPTINVGLVTFDGVARLAVEPSLDRAKLRRAIERAELHEGTAIGEAIFVSLDAIELFTASDEPTSGGGNGDGGGDEPPVPATVVLMSDGETTVGRPNELAVEAARTAGIPVSTIAFGTDSGFITIPGEDIPINVPVNRPALRDIARDTGGEFFTAASEGELATVYEDIGSSIGFETEEREITMWFVSSALVALLVTAALSLAWFSRLP